MCHQQHLSRNVVFKFLTIKKYAKTCKDQMRLTCFGTTLENIRWHRTLVHRTAAIFKFSRRRSGRRRSIWSTDSTWIHPCVFVFHQRRFIQQSSAKSFHRIIFFPQPLLQSQGSGRVNCKEPINVLLRGGIIVTHPFSQRLTWAL